MRRMIDYKEKKRVRGSVRRRAAACLLALVCVWGSVCQAQAAAQVVGDVQARRELPVVSNETEGWPKGPVVSAQSAVVMEVSTGAVLYEKNAHDPLYPASITKILTTLVALENSSMDETVTYSYDSIFSLDEGSSIIGGVNPGDQMSMKDVLYGIMICSGNEAAYAAAEHVGGTVEAFVQKMNERAAEIGCTDSNFENPHGLPNESHVTSAMDMALITKTALTNTSFRTIATTRRYTFPPTSRGEERIRLNHHQMMEGMEYAYEGCLGGKTGYTSAAGSTLVTFAEREGMTLICVVMNEEAPAQFYDTAALLDYGFANFRKVDMSGYGQEGDQEEKSFFLTEAAAGAKRTGLSVKQTGTAVLPVNASADELKGAAAGEEADGTVTSEFYYHGTYVGSSVMRVLAEESGRDRLFGLPQQQTDTTYDIFHPSEVRYIFINWKYLLLAGLGLAALGGGLALFLRAKERKRNRRRGGLVIRR